MSNSQLVYDNFVWRIQNIAPTSAIVTKKFLFNDSPGNFNPDQSSGTCRVFTVRYESGGEIHEPCDGTGYTRDLVFAVDVAYSTEIKLNLFSELVLSDERNLIKCLRDDAKWQGTSDDNPTTNIGLWRRILMGSTLDKTDAVTSYLKQKWACQVWESEI
jgi:hypothetical protein